MDTSYLSVLSRICPKRVAVFFFRRGLLHRFKRWWTKTLVNVNFACRVKRTKMWDSLI